MKHSLRNVALFAMLVILVPLTNLLVVLVQYQSFWFPRVASGHMTFLQAVYAEWIWYYTGHRYGSILLADLPGLALLLLLLTLGGYHIWSKRTGRANNTLGSAPNLFTSSKSSWPPAPKP